MFWEGHDPTQGMRQGNDRGTQYRSGVYVFDAAQRAAAEASKADYEKRLRASGFGPITTEIVDAGPFFYAEDYTGGPGEEPRRLLRHRRHGRELPDRRRRRLTPGRTAWLEAAAETGPGAFR